MRYLLTKSETTTLGDLAEHIASIENDKPEDALTSTERKRVYICLYQTHLPKMADAGVIDFEKDRKTEQRGARLAEVTRFLPEDTETGSAGSSNGMFTTAAALIETVGSRL